jgi:hypothetical protein
MGVVAVACVAVVSAPMLTARGGVHHRGGRPAERHQYLAGVDFTQDPAVAAATAARLMLARLDSAPLLMPKGPPEPSEDEAFSPFIAMNPPVSGFGRSGLRQPTAPPEAPTHEEPRAAVRDAHAQSLGLTPAVAAETPQTPPDVTPPPVLPPEPTVVPDPPPPPVIVVVETPPVDPPPPTPPPETRPVPAVFTPSVPVAAVVAAIPEPGTWAMLLVGFGAIGAAVRRRRRDRPVAEVSC